jgi:membrane protein implicated in regulation of membrane protease activity
MVEPLRTRLPWLIATLGLIAVLVVWNIYPAGASPLGDVIVTWMPALFFVAITVMFLSLAQRGVDETRRRNEERMDRIEKQLGRIVELLDRR